MLDREELIQAIDLHERSYNLLLWLSNAISKGIIKFDRAHDYMDESEAAAAWIQGHYLNLPPNCRPKNHEELKPFAQFFATYLTTSFQLEKRPDKQLKSGCGCLCPMCAYFVAGPHLKTKKIFRRDKERARKLKIQVVQQLSREHGTSLDRDRAEELIDSETHAANVAKLAYGQQLIERARGTSEGPAVLALWREFAWNKTGSPKKDFKLEAEDILRAEETVAKTIAEVA